MFKQTLILSSYRHKRTVQRAQSGMKWHKMLISYSKIVKSNHHHRKALRDFPVIRLKVETGPNHRV